MSVQLGANRSGQLAPLRASHLQVGRKMERFSFSSSLVSSTARSLCALARSMCCSVLTMRSGREMCVSWGSPSPNHLDKGTMSIPDCSPSLSRVARAVSSASRAMRIALRVLASDSCLVKRICCLMPSTSWSSSVSNSCSGG